MVTGGISAHEAGHEDVVADSVVNGGVVVPAAVADDVLFDKRQQRKESDASRLGRHGQGAVKKLM